MVSESPITIAAELNPNCIVVLSQSESSGVVWPSNCPAALPVPITSRTSWGKGGAGGNSQPKSAFPNFPAVVLLSQGPLLPPVRVADPLGPPGPIPPCTLTPSPGCPPPGP